MHLYRSIRLRVGYGREYIDIDVTAAVVVVVCRVCLHIISYNAYACELPTAAGCQVRSNEPSICYPDSYVHVYYFVSDVSSSVPGRI